MDQLGVARRQLDAVVASLPRPCRHLAKTRRHAVHLVGRHRVHRRPQERRAEGERQFGRSEQRPLPLFGVRMVPGLHRVDAAVADLQEDRRALGVHGVDHLSEGLDPLPRVHKRHARRGASFLVDARVALHDQAHARSGVGDELAGVELARVGTGASALEHRRPVQTVAHDSRADPQGCVENGHGSAPSRARCRGTGPGAG